MIHKRVFLIAAILGIAATASTAQALKDPYHRAAGQIGAAVQMASCSGITGRQGKTVQEFILFATDRLASQGLRKQKLRRTVFYEKTARLNAMKAAVLAERGVDAQSKRAVCAFATRIAGTNDVIGQLLGRR